MQSDLAQHLRQVAREVAAAASANEARGQAWRQARSAVLARLYLRHCTHIGLNVRVYGRPRIFNEGTLTIGERVQVWSTIVPSELAVFQGGKLEIGDGTTINYGSSIGATGLVRIGRSCVLGTYSMILDNDFHEIERRDVMPPPRPVVIEDNVWLANRTLILPGVTIGQDSVVGAGSVVTADVPARCIVLGNPARVIETF